MRVAYRVQEDVRGLDVAVQYAQLVQGRLRIVATRNRAQIPTEFQRTRSSRETERELGGLSSQQTVERF